ncbi:MAG: hypothetical protein RLZZ426_316 [Actinomycetota bacterium]|jgi:arabinogalactan oligomer/maltooligosaccharide transport system substrate-binding protein
MFHAKGRFAAVATVSAMALSTFVAVMPAEAAVKTIIVWADEKRGPQLQSLLLGKTPVPGYKVKVRAFSSFDALAAAWTASTAATGPDIVIGSGAWAVAGGKSGKMAVLTYTAKAKAGFSKAAVGGVSYKGKAYGVPIDVDTTAFMVNTGLAGAAAAAKNLPAMVAWFKANKVSKGLTGGFCSSTGDWGSQPIWTGFGGGAWKYTAGGAPIPGQTSFNSSTFKTNVNKYLKDGPTGDSDFFKFGGCFDDVKAGKIAFAGVGAWNTGDLKSANVKYTLGAFPGMTNTTKAAQWVNYSGAFLTSFANRHSVATGAKSFLMNYIASATVQAQLAIVSGRPPANTAAAKSVSDPQVKAIAKAAQTGIPQIGSMLDNNTAGANWYALIGDVYSKIWNDGDNVSDTLDAAAAKMVQNFNAGKP